MEAPETGDTLGSALAEHRGGYSGYWLAVTSASFVLLA